RAGSSKGYAWRDWRAEEARSRQIDLLLRKPGLPQTGLEDGVELLPKLGVVGDLLCALLEPGNRHFGPARQRPVSCGRGLRVVARQRIRYGEKYVSDPVFPGAGPALAGSDGFLVAAQRQKGTASDELIGADVARDVCRTYEQRNGFLCPAQVGQVERPDI